MNNNKLRHLMFKAIEKARIALNSDDTANIQVEAILEDGEDFQRDVTRDEFNNLIQGVVQQLTVLLENALS